MTVKRYTGDKYTALNADTKPLDAVDGAILYELDTGFIYYHYLGSWSTVPYIDAANLTLGTITSTTIDIDIDTGTDVTLPAATVTDAGLLTASDKAKLDGIGEGAEANPNAYASLSDGTNTATAETVSDEIIFSSTNTLLGITVSDVEDADTVTFALDDDLSLYDNATSGFISDITNELIGDLQDVLIATPSTNEVLFYDSGGDWVNRAITEADISDFGTYDNYVSWNLDHNTSGSPASITSGATVDFVEGGSTSITRTGSTVTISSTDYVAGTGLVLSGATFNLDFSELTDLTAAISGTDEFIIQNGTTESRKAASEIDVSVFNNDAGYAADQNLFDTVAVTDTDSGYTWAETGSAVADTTADTLTLVSGPNVDIDVDAASDAIRISSTDTNFYLSGLSFDTGTGILTATVTGATNQTVDLDGRYVLQGNADAFSTIAVTTSGEVDVVADSAEDTLTFAEGANGLLTFATNDTSDTITFQVNDDLSLYDNTTSGFTTNDGTVTSIGITAGALIDVTNSPITTSGNITIDVDLTELADGTLAIDGAADEIVYLDAGVQKRKLVSEWDLGQFNNDQNWTSNDGTVTSVAVSGSDGIEVDSGSPVTTSGTIALGVNAATLRTHINVEDGAAADQNLFDTFTVTDTDSGYTWAGTGSASPDTTADTLTLVSGNNVDIDVDATNDAIRISSSTDLGETVGTSTVEITNTAGTNATIPAATGSAAGLVSTGTQTFAGEKTFNDAVIISGNLTVSGTTTSINTETLTVDDNIIVLNNNEAGTPSQNAGIEVERGTSTNVLIRWNEANDEWEFTNDGSTYFNLVTDVNLGVTTAASTVDVTSNEGTDATIPAATTSDAGVMSASDKTKLDGVETGATADQDLFNTFTVTDTDSGYTWTETGSVSPDTTTDTLTLVSGSNIDIDVDSASDAIRISADGGPAFSTVSVSTSGQADVVAESSGDTLNLAEGANGLLTFATDAGSDTVTFEVDGNLSNYTNDAGFLTETQSAALIQGAWDFEGSITHSGDGTADIFYRATDGTNTTIFGIQDNGIARAGTETSTSFEFATNNTTRLKFNGGGGITAFTTMELVTGSTMNGSVLLTEASSINDLSDVVLTTPSVDEILFYQSNGDWVNRAITEADISDLGTYDNYGSWNLDVNTSGSTESITSGATVDFVGSGATTVSKTGSTVTISSSDQNLFNTFTVTDTDSGYTWAETGSLSPDTTTDTLTLVSGNNIDIDIDSTNDAIRIATTADPNQNAFSNVAVSGQTTVAADTPTDTLTLVEGDGIDIQTDAGSDSVTISVDYRIDSVTPSTTTTFDMTTSDDFHVILDANTTFAFTVDADSVGKSGMIVIEQDATGGHTFTLPTSAKTPAGGASIAQVTTASTVSILNYFVFSTTSILVNYIGDFQ